MSHLYFLCYLRCPRALCVWILPDDAPRRKIIWSSPPPPPLITPSYLLFCVCFAASPQAVFPFQINACLKSSLLLAVNCEPWGGGLFFLRDPTVPTVNLKLQAQEKHWHTHVGLLHTRHVSKETTSWTFEQKVLFYGCVAEGGLRASSVSRKWCQRTPCNTSTNENGRREKSF